MARLASSTHWAEATMAADGGCSRDRVIPGVLGGEGAGGAGRTAGPAGVPPTGGGVVGADVDGGEAHPQSSKSGRQQNMAQVITRNARWRGALLISPIMATSSPDAQPPGLSSRARAAGAVWGPSSPLPGLDYAAHR